MWKEGTIGIPQPDGKNHVIHFWVKHFNEPSEEYGINKGRMVKLSLKLNGKWITNYDKGWDTEPTCKEAEICLSILLNTIIKQIPTLESYVTHRVEICLISSTS